LDHAIFATVVVGIWARRRPGEVQRLDWAKHVFQVHLRKLLVVGAHAVLYHRKPHEDVLRFWAKKLIQTKPFKLVTVALANKMAPIAFAILHGKTTYGSSRRNDRRHRQRPRAAKELRVTKR
jgi:transposase